MNNFLLKEKPYIRLHDASQPFNTVRLKLSEESWEKARKFHEDEQANKIPVYIHSTMWECKHCGQKMILDDQTSQEMAKENLAIEGCCSKPCPERVERNYSLEANL